MKALAPHWGALLALALFLVAGLAVLDDYGVTLDEPWQRSTGIKSLRYLLGDWDALPEYQDKFFSVVFEAPLLLAERALGLDGVRSIYLAHHLLIHTTFLTGGLFAYLLGYRLFGARLLAVVAMLLFLLHPRLYGHSFFNPKDIPFLAMFMIALFLAHRALRRDTLSAFALLGVGVGLLVNLRIMGVVLLAGIPALRALDFALASGWAERKRVLLTTGGFALAGALIIYALLPYLWSDPIPRAVEGWATLSKHPIIFQELFRGTLYLNVDFPATYLPLWFSITSPPFALLLGGIGGAAILVAAARAPRKALRSGRLRFGLLAAACFAAPVLGALLLDANMYNGWRQMFFLWAPFSLLGAYGVHWLTGAHRRTLFRMAAFGAAGAGLAGAALSMALIHPNQQAFFNVLEDRATPTHLASNYRMDYWGHPLRQALNGIVKSEPLAQSGPFLRGNDYGSFLASALALPDGEREDLIDALQGRYSSVLLANALFLSESARERLADADPFDFVGSDRLESWSRSARELHRAEVYGNALRTVEWRDDLREVHEAVRGREPVIDAAFDVHRIDGALALVKEPCAPSFVERSSVILRAFPVDAGDLPTWREGKAFEPRYFDLNRYGAYFEGKCAAALPLPAYPIADFELRWGAEPLGEAEARERARLAREEGRLLARGFYDIHLMDGELVYLRDPCDPAETAQPFHLNVYPERVGDLPEERREQGYERFHFEFLLNGAFVDGGCAAFFSLPGYPAAGIQTGQRDGEGGDLWFAEFWIDPARRWAESAADASGEPVGRGVFDVHLADGALVYVKEPCDPADTEARFFLHITPERAGDLPEERRARGFDNLDFAFFPNGGLFDGKCAARATLPEYAIAFIRTGQYASGVGEIWSAEFAVGM